jgi:hypothetical protein
VLDESTRKWMYNEEQDPDEHLYGL